MTTTNKRTTPKKGSGLAEPIQRVATLDHLKKRQPITRTLPIYLDQEAFDRYTEALTNYENEEQRPRRVDAETERLDTLRAERDAAEEALNESTVVITLRSIGRKAYEAIVDANQPTNAQKERAAKEAKEMGARPQPLPYNPDTFAPALIAATVIEPPMTPEDVQEIMDDWNQPEIIQLFTAAMEVCQSSRVGHLGKGSGRTAPF